MKIQTQSIKFHADSNLLDVIQKRLDKLERLFDKIVDAEVILRIENDSHRENKLVEIKLNLPGEQLFTKSHATSFEIATDEAAEALRRQLKKYKEKLQSH